MPAPKLGLGQSRLTGGAVGGSSGGNRVGSGARPVSAYYNYGSKKPETVAGNERRSPSVR